MKSSTSLCLIWSHNNVMFNDEEVVFPFFNKMAQIHAQSDQLGS